MSHIENERYVAQGPCIGAKLSVREQRVSRAVCSERQAVSNTSNVMNGEGAGMSQLIKLIGAKQCSGAFDEGQRSSPCSSPSPQDTQPC